MVDVEFIFCWYWLADLGEAEAIDFVLGHALYMKSTHGAKTKNDRIDPLKSHGTESRPSLYHVRVNLLDIPMLQGIYISLSLLMIFLYSILL